MPSPSAVVVLLGAIALGRAWFGVALVVAYGLGMAVTLTGAGLLLVRARGAIERRLVTSGLASGRLASAAAALPLLTPACIIAAGLFLAGHRGFRRRGWWAVVTLLWGLAGGAVAVAGLSELASDDGQGRWLISVSIALLAAGLSALAPGRDVGATAR